MVPSSRAIGATWRVLPMSLLVVVASQFAAAQQAPSPAAGVPPASSTGGPLPMNWTAEQDHQNMMDQLGIKALRPGANGNEKAPDHANYDESKANPFPDLPDALTLKNGQRVTTAAQWRRDRRPEIVEDFEREVVGRIPVNVPGVTWTVTSATNSKAGVFPVIEKQLIGHVDNSTCPSISVDVQMTLVTPGNAKGPVPVMMMFGSQAFLKRMAEFMEKRPESKGMLGTDPPSTEQLIAAADIAAPGTASITVKNPTPGGGVSNIAYFVVTNPTAAVNYVNAPGSPFSPGGDGDPVLVAVGDWNHDGKPDLVVGNNVPSGTGSVSFETLLNNGNGTFTVKATYVVVSNGSFAGVTAIVPGDFNGDGIPDLAVVEGSTSIVQLWLGNGDGTFTLKSTTAAGSGPTSAVAGDFNADGNLDLAVGSFNGNNISILLGNGNGTFTAGTTVHAPGSYDVNAMTVGDFNNDGILDLATACDDTCVVVFPGNNNGTFGSPIVTTTGAAYTGFFGIVAGDFNHDGNLDLAATNTNNVVEILLGKGDGTFSAGSTLASGPFPTGLTLGDFNGDGF